MCNSCVPGSVDEAPTFHLLLAAVSHSYDMLH
jgi:hypothetical protein